ncbi:hypothetical protein GVAV_001115 [Gurleya vavrai]
MISFLLFNFLISVTRTINQYTKLDHETIELDYLNNFNITDNFYFETLFAECNPKEENNVCIKNMIKLFLCALDKEILEIARDKNFFDYRFLNKNLYKLKKIQDLVVKHLCDYFLTDQNFTISDKILYASSIKLYLDHNRNLLEKISKDIYIDYVLEKNIDLSKNVGGIIDISFLDLVIDIIELLTRKYEEKMINLQKASIIDHEFTNTVKYEERINNFNEAPIINQEFTNKNSRIDILKCFFKKFLCFTN